MVKEDVQADYRTGTPYNRVSAYADTRTIPSITSVENRRGEEVLQMKKALRSSLISSIPRYP